MVVFSICACITCPAIAGGDHSGIYDDNNNKYHKFIFKLSESELTSLT